MPTIDLERSVREVWKRDPRFRLEAYMFVLDALDHAMSARARAADPGAATPGQAAPEVPPPVEVPGVRRASEGGGEAVPPWNVGGRDLLEAARDLAVDRFGALAAEVFASWGIRATEDVGTIVFNLVAGGILQKTATDSMEDYRGIFDLATAFERRFAERLASEPVRVAARRQG